MQHCPARAARQLAAAALALVLLLALAAPRAHAALQEKHGIRLLTFDHSQILSIGNQTSGKCSWYALRYARTILDGRVCSGSGMWSNGAVWSAGGYTGYSGDLSACLHTIYNELSAGRPVIVHLKNTTVSGVSKHANRTSTYEYHLSGSGWTQVNYPHIATSDTYGHWVCVVGISPTADPEGKRLLRAGPGPCFGQRNAGADPAAGRHHLDCQLSPQNCRLKIERAKRRTHLRPPFLHASVIQ